MNARLQVEHPVTELVTGLDLVGLQLAVAAGEPLPLGQDDVTLRGSAIEARLYAENERGMPSGGRLDVFSLPEGAGVRNDAGFEAGDPVPTAYDAMLAKLIVHAPDRPSAVGRLRRALLDYGVLGVPTNLPLLRRIAAHPAFEAGRTTTGFLEQHSLTEPPPPRPVPREALLLAAAAELHGIPALTDPFAAGPWRLLGAAQLRYLSGGAEHSVEAERAGRGGSRITAEGEASSVEVLYSGNGLLRATIDGRPVEAWVVLAGAEIRLSLGGEAHTLQKVPPRP